MYVSVTSGTILNGWLFVFSITFFTRMALALGLKRFFIKSYIFRSPCPRDFARLNWVCAATQQITLYLGWGGFNGLLKVSLDPFTKQIIWTVVFCGFSFPSVALCGFRAAGWFHRINVWVNPIWVHKHLVHRGWTQGKWWQAGARIFWCRKTIHWT